MYLGQGPPWEAGDVPITVELTNFFCEMSTKLEVFPLSTVYLYKFSFVVLLLFKLINLCMYFMWQHIDVLASVIARDHDLDRAFFPIRKWTWLGTETWVRLNHICNDIKTLGSSNIII